MYKKIYRNFTFKYKFIYKSSNKNKYGIYKKWSTKPIKLFIILIFLIIRFLEINFLKNQISSNNKLNNFHEQNKTKVCLCAIAKRENLYIKFFIEHYKNLGYDHIFLYDNNDINYEKVEDIIKDGINNGFVTLIDYRGIRRNGENPQMDAYYECYEKHNLEYDWLSFFDIDEYLMLKPEGIDIHKFLESERYKNCPNVKINWLIYSDNNQTKYEKKPFNERFTTVSKWANTRKTIKSIMRGNIPYQNLSKTYNPHYLYNNVKNVHLQENSLKEHVFILHLIMNLLL